VGGGDVGGRGESEDGEDDEEPVAGAVEVEVEADCW
jgi:hypothetical protein